MNNHITTTCLSFLLLCFTISANAQKPKNGTYTYTIAFAEWQGKSLGNTCTVVIKGDSVKVLHNGKGTLTGKKGEVIAQGILVQHQSGKWIIARSPKDKYAKEVGGCADGPSEIDIKRKRFWLC